MKKILVAVSLAMASSVAVADNNIGCGFGTQVWKGQSGLLPKILGATTNGTSGNQTFGITFGTLGCSSDGVVTASARTAMFINNNAEALARDIAVGEGETLNVLASLMGIEADKKAHFNQVAKANFGKIYTSEKVTTDQIHAALKAIVANDAVLNG